MNVIIIIMMAIKKRIEISKKITLIDKRMILRTLRIRIEIPTTDATDIPILYTSHTQAAINTTLNPNLMLGVR